MQVHVRVHNGAGRIPLAQRNRQQKDEPVTGEPSVHGVYDYFLGGWQHLHADRELGRAIAERFPQVPEHIRAAQDFHLRAARWAAERGITRFIRGGPVTALPGGRNVHDAARAVSPAAEVIYVSWDPDAHKWAQEMLTGGDRTHAVLAEPGNMEPGPEVAAMLASGEPMCVIAGLVLHFMPGETAAALTAHVAAALPPGSVAVLSLAVPGESAEAAELLRMFTPAHVYRHTAADVARWLADAGLEIVPPGVRDLRFRLGSPVRAAGKLTARAPGLIAGALAVKP